MASENFRGGCRCRDARCLLVRRCEPGHFRMGSKTDDETRAGVRYYFGVFPDGQDLRHVLYSIPLDTVSQSLHASKPGVIGPEGKSLGVAVPCRLVPNSN